MELKEKKNDPAADQKPSLKTLTELKSPEELRAAAEHSVKGFLAVLFGEKAFRTDLVVFFITTLVASVLPVTWCERALLIYTVFMALICETINTAIETVVDRISMEFNVLSGRAKDIGSFLVFAAFLGAGICWAIILFGLVWDKFIA